MLYKDKQCRYYEIELELDSQAFANGDLQYKLVPGVQVHVFILDWRDEQY